MKAYKSETTQTYLNGLKRYSSNFNKVKVNEANVNLVFGPTVIKQAEAVCKFRINEI
jgi:hypothetical protein